MLKLVGVFLDFTDLISNSHPERIRTLAKHHNCDNSQRRYEVDTNIFRTRNWSDRFDFPAQSTLDLP